MQMTREQRDALASMRQQLNYNRDVYDERERVARHYSGRPPGSRHGWMEDPAGDLVATYYFIYDLLISQIDSVLKQTEPSSLDVEPLLRALSSCQAVTRVAIDYLNHRFMNEQPLNTLVGAFDGLLRTIDLHHEQIVAWDAP